MTWLADRAEWNGAALKEVLATVREELGLPNAARLTADLHGCRWRATGLLHRLHM